MKQSYYAERHYRLHDFDQRYPFLHLIAETLAERFAPKRVLDIGCAEGYLVYAFYNLGIEAYGVDISQYAISHGSQRIREHLFRIDVDCEGLPFEDKSFDIVTAIDIVEHLRNYEKTICEIGRVLKPGGIACITTPANKLTDAILAMALRHPLTRHQKEHVNIHPKSFWIRTFQRYGFDYVSDFPKDILRMATIAQTPATKAGHLLMRFGKLGRWLRDRLAFRFRSEALLFRQKGSP
jgi:ubiquinone/menaquinone biosynthesis C-methylase UbiE